jgi:23S rRNA pseudouridine1911/1915/1917 synthase
VVADGQAAETGFAIVRRFPAALLVEARPATGRKHQIRAHLAEAGAPILGDARYGGPASAAGTPVPRVMLHAAALRLAHPVTGESLDIRCPRPADFQRLLDHLDRTTRSLDRPRASR